MQVKNIGGHNCETCFWFGLAFGKLLALLPYGKDDFGHMG